MHTVFVYLLCSMLITYLVNKNLTKDQPLHHHILLCSVHKSQLSYTHSNHAVFRKSLYLIYDLRHHHYMAQKAASRSSENIYPAGGPDFSHEGAHADAVCGIDEAGRAPLAGPVSAACVFVPADKQKLDFWDEVNDSKKLSLKKRERLFDLIIEHCHYGMAVARVEEIDTLNIHYATFLAMRRSFKTMCDNFDLSPAHALIDGKFTPELSCPATPLIKGDGRSLSIAAASILAKVSRDRYMKQLHEEFPQYGWDSNAGYPTKAHLDGLRAHGATIHHRRSFAPVRQYSLPL